MKKKTLFSSLLSIASLFSITLPISKVEANTNLISLSNTNNGFLEGEKSFSKEQSFVYSSYVNFTSGQAGGIVFGMNEENSYCYVLNVDRIDNRVKLMKFSKDDSEYKFDSIIREDYYVGNDKMTSSEEIKVKEKMKDVPYAQLKVIVSNEEDNTYVECYVDGIRRFGNYDVISSYHFNDIILDDYQGGKLGYNCYNSNVYFTNTEIGKSDYSYYTEAYRNQYHFSQFRGWNNDPNGLVYYKGYYHLYYQTMPFSQDWGDMYWGHARSVDLVHWELMPIALFPEAHDPSSPLGVSGDGYMWSGSSFVYHKGDSKDIDNLNYFPNGNGDGLIAFYTRDGTLGGQVQVLMTSDDEGLTWTKRKVVPRNLITDNVSGINSLSSRDPKVFPIKKENNKTTMWGMIISNMEDNQVYLLKSSNLLDWSFAGNFSIYRPECVDVISINDENGNLHNVFTFEGREYIVGSIEYDEGTGKIELIDYNNDRLSSLKVEEQKTKKMDFGPDSYATQSFYIDDVNSKYYGKTIAMSWFSGVPGGKDSIDSGSFKEVRYPWNGGGMTIPVIYSLKEIDDEYYLAQTPITLDNSALKKEQIVNVTNCKYDIDSQNIFKDVNTHNLEIKLEVDNPSLEDVEIRVNVGEDEYTQIGWNKVDGYYVDRSHTSKGGINFSASAYDKRYKTGPVDGNKLSFYILVDEGGVEAFLGDYTYPFYLLTLASSFSKGCELITTGEINIISSYANQIKSVYLENQPLDEGVLNLSSQEVELDLNISKTKEIYVNSTIQIQTLDIEIIEGEDIVEIEKTDKGLIISSLKEGNSVIKVSTSFATKYINVTIHKGNVDSNIPLNDGNKYQSNWLIKENGLNGKNNSGDGFYLLNQEYSNFIYSSTFDLSSCQAAALIFGAKDNMNQYTICNYDKNERKVKLWNESRMLKTIDISKDIDITNVNLAISCKNSKIKIYLNQELIIDEDFKDNINTLGKVGFNVFKGEVNINNIELNNYSINYENKDVYIPLNGNSYISKIINETYKNTLVDRDFYKIENGNLIIFKEYFDQLENNTYSLNIYGDNKILDYLITVDKNDELTLFDVEIQEGTSLNIYIGLNEIKEVIINNQMIDLTSLKISNKVLTIPSSLLELGVNNIMINGSSFEVKVNPLSSKKIINQNNINLGLILGLSISLGVILISGMVITSVILVRKRKKCQ